MASVSADATRTCTALTISSDLNQLDPRTLNRSHSHPDSGQKRMAAAEVTLLHPLGAWRVDCGSQRIRLTGPSFLLSLSLTFSRPHKYALEQFVGLFPPSFEPGDGHIGASGDGEVFGRVGMGVFLFFLRVFWPRGGDTSVGDAKIKTRDPG